MKFNEIFPEFEAGKLIRRKSWPLNRRISNKAKISFCNFDYNADDWEVWEEPPYDEFLEEMKHYLYYELEFHKNRQSQYYLEENMDISDIWNVINNYYLDKESIYKLLKYIKENNLVKK